MNRKSFTGTAAVVLVALVSAALLGACGNQKQEARPAFSGDVVNLTPTSATPTSVAGNKRCADCHAAANTAWLKTRHANLNEDPPAGFFSPTTAGSGCPKCHDALNTYTYTDVTSTIKTATLTKNNTGLPRPVIACESCHGLGNLHADNGGTGPIEFIATSYTQTTLGQITVSGQFMTCTKCHMLLNSDGTGTTVPQHFTDHATGALTPDENIVDTHFALPGIYSASGSNSRTISGYAMDFSNQKVCTNCHNPHGTADINRDWAASAHADKTTPGAWSHYNHSCDGDAAHRLSCGPTDTSIRPNDRRYCQRCHTTSGFVAYADALASGNTTLAKNIHAGLASQITFTTGWKPEMLECNGCHTDNRGSIRNPGAFKTTYDYWVRPQGTPSGTPEITWGSADYQYPNEGTSNVCIPCHSGRTNGDSIHSLNTAGQPTTADFTNLKSANSHDFPTAGIMFTAIGYEYAGRDYANPSSYVHDKIGTAAVPNTGTGGPCVGCHMYRSGATASHLFTNVNTFGSGTSAVTTVSSAVCFECHPGSSSSLGEILDAESSAYQDAQSAVKYCLTTGTTSTNYKTSGGNWLSPGDSDKTGNGTGKNNLGAVFNIGSLGNEPGAFVHNSKYVKRLMYDSIDWVDDNTLNNSAGKTLSAICSKPSPSAWCAKGMPYLLPNGVRTGAPSERPY